MSEVKFLAFGIGIFILVGLFFVNVADNFTTEEELNNTWVSNYYVDKISSFPIELIKYPVSAVTILTDFMDGDFWDWLSFKPSIQAETAYVNLSGTGTHEGDTLDGRYVYNNDVPEDNNTLELEFWHEDDTNLFTSNRRHIYVTINQTNIISSEVTVGLLFGIQSQVYNYTSISDTDLEYIKNITYEKTDYSFDWNNNSYGEFVVGEKFRADEQLSGYETNAEKVFNFFDEASKKLEESVRMFGIIPVEIGLPIFLAFFIGALYLIIKLLPFT